MKFFYTLFIPLLFIFPASLEEKGITLHEITFLENYYHETFKILEEEVDDLTRNQLNYRPKDGGWSVIECLEHIILAEEALFQNMKRVINQNQTNLTKNVSSKDGLVITGITNRGVRAKTQKPFEPTGRWKTKKEMIETIKSNREKTLNFIKKNRSYNVRHLFTESPVGEIDLYQFYILYAAHGHRHTLQIKEILREQKEAN